MSRTDLDPATLANALRGMAGDGSMEWVMEPVQARVLLDVADALDENDQLRELARDIYGEYRYLRVRFHRTYVQHEERMRSIERRMRELGMEVEA